MGNELTDAERMTKFETQLENVVMVVTRMETKMEAWQANFVSKELLEEKLKVRDRENERLGQEIQRLEREKAEKDDIERLEKDKSSFKTNLPFWFTVVLEAITLIYALWPKK